MRADPNLVSWGVVWLIAAAWLVAGVPPAIAQIYTDVYFFGDSLSDTGNGCAALAFIPGYEDGRCSNGEVWSERFAQGLGLDAQASSQGGTNFAVGSQVAADLALQIDAFSLLQFPPSADPDALYVIWIGGNDVLDLPSSPTAMQDAVDDIIDGIDDLKALGAEHFLVPNLPDIGRAYGTFSFITGADTAFTPAERDLATSLSLDFNSRLATALAGETFTTLFELEIEGWVEEVFANPASFGIAAAAIDATSDDTDFGIPCLLDSNCAADPKGPIADTFFLFDAVHPTTAMHAEIASRAAALVPEPSVAAGAAAALLALGLLAMRQRREG